ncbi:sensor histidine kinase [Nonomuraea cavernae]|uniref:sensor histidine kinase n=1 Tax=Nonomuraea cavernae TaxID=2045107 RepID=UPI0033F5FDCE
MDAIKRARLLSKWVLLSLLGMMWLCLALALLTEVAMGTAQWLRVAPALVATVCFSRLYLRIVDALLDSRYASRQIMVAGALALFATVVGGGNPFGWGFTLMVWLSVATVGISGRRAVALSAATFAVAVLVGVANAAADRSLTTLEAGDVGANIVAVIAYAVMAVSFPASNRLWIWIYELARQAHEGKEAHARLAVTEERLRFARDLHDLVGHQLSLIAVKSGLAVRLSGADESPARTEMAEVHTLTRKALRELRQAVRGYRELDLPAELDSVKSVLEAAGVRCELHLPYRELPDGVAPVFAYAVREAVTNVLKHSSATFCDITLSFTAERAELRVRNDGVVRYQVDELGSGLSGMGERLAAVGGELTARPTGDGEFTLSAVVSLPIRG